MTGKGFQMLVTVDNGELRLTFGYDKLAIEKIKLIDGARWDKERKMWFVPLGNAHLVVKRFPDASYSPEAIAAVLEAENAIARGLMGWLERNGVRFALDGDGDLVVNDTMKHMSDVAWDLVDGYTPEIKRLLGERVITELSQPARNNSVTIEPTKGDKLIHAGIQNAAKRAGYTQLSFFEGE